MVVSAMNLVTGHPVFRVREKHYARDFQAFMREVRRHYRGWHVVLLLDGDSSHAARASQVVARQPGFRLRWLPKRAPELNPMVSEMAMIEMICKKMPLSSMVRGL